jgi:hypothetical protein
MVRSRNPALLILTGTAVSWQTQAPFGRSGNPVVTAADLPIRFWWFSSGVAAARPCADEMRTNVG